MILASGYVKDPDNELCTSLQFQLQLSAAPICLNNHNSEKAAQGSAGDYSMHTLLSTDRGETAEAAGTLGHSKEQSLQRFSSLCFVMSMASKLSV